MRPKNLGQVSSSASPISQCYFSHVSRFSLRGRTAISITHTKRVSAFSQRTRSLLLSTLWEVPVRFSHSSALSSYPATDAFSLSLTFAYSIASQWLHYSPYATLADCVPCDYTDTSHHKAHPKLNIADTRKKREDMGQKEHNKQTKSSRTALSVSIVLIGTVPGCSSHCCSKTTRMSSHKLQPQLYAEDLLCLMGL